MIIRRIHQTQDRHIKKHKSCRHGHHKGHAQIYRHGNIMAHLLVILCAKALGHHDGKATGDSLQPPGHQKNQRGCAADGRQGMDPDIAAGNHRIDQIVKLLENVSEICRNHKSQDQADGISPCHIICHDKLLLPFPVMTIRLQLR